MEIKQINVDSEISQMSYEDQLQLKTMLNQGKEVELILGLSLLKEELSNVISFKFINFSFILKLSKEKYSTWDSLDYKNSVFKGKLSVNAIDYILHYLLKFYSNGFADAEHIDIDFFNEDKKEITLTINCNNYYEYSEDAIKKMLT